jgi:hypothetical protein
MLLPIFVFNASAASTVVSVDPSNSNVTGGATFSVNVTVTDVTNLTCWQFNLYYLNSVITCTSVSEGPLLESGGGTYFQSSIFNNYNSTTGYAQVYDTLLGFTSVNGSGVIATVNFQVIGGGSTPLHLGGTKLGDTAIPPNPIPITTSDGVVNVTGGVHNVAMLNVTSLKGDVGRGYLNNFTVTLKNTGNFQETFNVSVIANATELIREEVTVPSGNSMAIILVWNSTEFAYGNYSISAYAWPVQNETWPDNNVTGGTVYVGIPGDLNSDGTVDIFDAVLFAGAFGSTPGSPHWNPNADINGDGSVDIFDAVILAAHFNQHYP